MTEMGASSIEHCNDKYFMMSVVSTVQQSTRAEFILFLMIMIYFVSFFCQRNNLNDLKGFNFFDITIVDIAIFSLYL